MPSPNWVQWSFKSDVPSARSGAPAAIHNDSIYVFGGYGGSGRLNDVWRLDLTAKKWSLVACIGQHPEGRESNGAFIHANRIFLFGGYSGTTWLNDSHCLTLSDADTGEWSQVILPSTSASPPSPRFGYAGAELDGFIWVFGGYDGTAWLDDLHALDLTTMSWRIVNCPDGPSPRSGQSFVELNSALWLFGGYDGAERLNDLYSFRNGEWVSVRAKGVPPSPRYLHGSVAIGHSVYIFGGFSGADRLNDLWEFRVDLHSWSRVNCHSTPLGRSSLVTKSFNGSMIIFGGFSGKTVMNDVWEVALSPSSVPPSTLLADLKKLINLPEYTDACFVVDGVEVKANRALLAARSDHFKAMFYGGLRESHPVPIPLHDISLETFKFILHFIATDELPFSARHPNCAMLLLIAAERFLLDRLKAMCEEALKAEISPEGVVRLLLAAHKHGASSLKESCLEYIVDHEALIKAAVPDTLKDLVNEPTLLLEVLMRRPPPQGADTGTR